MTSAVESFLQEFIKLCDSYSIVFLPNKKHRFHLLDNKNKCTECAVSVVRRKGQTKTKVTVFEKSIQEIEV